MKHICITYSMMMENEKTESCIVLPMTYEIADDLLTKGAKSLHLDLVCIGEVYRVLKSLSTIQGYEYEKAYHFEEVKH